MSIAWEAIAAEAARLAWLVDVHALGAEIRWRVAALERATEARSVELLPLALGATGRLPPPPVEAWSYDGVTSADEIAEAAVWHLAVAGLEPSEGAPLDVLRGPRAVTDALAERC